jgi:hypothetical protein
VGEVASAGRGRCAGLEEAVRVAVVRWTAQAARSILRS